MVVPSKPLLRGFVALVCGCAVADAALAQMHGFVDPCQVSFQVDNQTECELCEPRANDPKHCEQLLASRGYAFRCRTTPGHSKPGEVWCAPKGRVANSTKQWVVAAVATAALGAVVVFARRGRSRLKRSQRTR
jgi:hypothetical protein